MVLEGIPTMQIAPAKDGGSLKNEGSERTIPVHPAIIDQGFLDFVATKGDGPLFYRRHIASNVLEKRNSPGRNAAGWPQQARAAISCAHHAACASG